MWWCFAQYLEYSHSAHEEELSNTEQMVLKFVKDKVSVTARDVSRKFKAEFSSASKAEDLLRRPARKGKVSEVTEEKASAAGRPKSAAYRMPK